MNDSAKVWSIITALRYVDGKLTEIYEKNHASSNYDFHGVELSIYEAAILSLKESEAKLNFMTTSAQQNGRERDMLMEAIEWAIKTWNSGVTQEEVFNKLRKALNDTNGTI